LGGSRKSDTYERIAKEQSMPGVIEVVSGSQVGRVIEDILMLLECSFDGELALLLAGIVSISTSKTLKVTG
jgi:hypothetical protein